ncbi:MAG: tetrahydrofolate dehydrogenase/cyclohydrolase catalytic domain-containing protein, partial [bacterium]|nr:tetrahydrofolate dehydrogenase/cyclohydrolase catalytic domain-containing protein [bacterium]
MSAQIIDGKQIATQIKHELQQKISALKAKNITPGLATVLVGKDPASATYVRMKEKMCDELGILTKSHRLNESASEAELLEMI